MRRLNGNELVAGALTGAATTYSWSTLEEVDAVPFASGEELLLVASMQARNGARARIARGAGRTGPRARGWSALHQSAPTGTAWQINATFRLRQSRRLAIACTVAESFHRYYSRSTQYEYVGGLYE